MLDIECHVPVWNEEFMLPRFLRHHDFCRKIVVHDNGSTDGTRDVASSDPRVEVREWDTGGELDNEKLADLKNSCWKNGGDSEWVMVCDVDEFLMLDPLLLGWYRGERVAFEATGFNMIGFGEPLEDIRNGARSELFNKVVLFSRDVEEINYAPGAHLAFPSCPVVDGVDLRHYNALSLEYMIARNERYKTRRSDRDRAKRYGVFYDWSAKSVKVLFKRIRAAMQQMPSLRELDEAKWVRPFSTTRPT